MLTAVEIVETVLIFLLVAYTVILHLVLREALNKLKGIEYNLNNEKSVRRNHVDNLKAEIDRLKAEISYLKGESPY